MSQPLRSPADLRVDAHAAEHLQHAQRQILAVVAYALGDLRRKLASGRKHERTRRAVARGDVGGEPLQNGQHESRGLARAGLRAREHIAAREHRRNGLQLDGGGRVVAFIGNSTQQFGRRARDLKMTSNILKFDSHGGLMRIRSGQQRGENQVRVRRRRTASRGRY